MTDKDCHIDISVQDPRWQEFAWLEPCIEQAVHAAISIVGKGAGAELSLALLNNQDMAQLNHTYRGKNAATNVLSFPAQVPGDISLNLLGDIVLAYETVCREAQAADIEISNHVSHLVIHGFLHLLGYDHVDDVEAMQMQALEVQTLARLGVENPYAIREEL